MVFDTGVPELLLPFKIIRMFGPKTAIFSIKHDLARSCFQLWPKIGDEGDKISRKKLARR